MQKQEMSLRKVWVLSSLVLSFGLSSCTKSCQKEGTSSTTKQVSQQLQIEDLVVGTGATALADKKVSVHYTGWLLDGKQFDSSENASTPFEFVLGKGSVIAGWEQGLLGMKEGGKRKLVIPPQLAYGDMSIGVIPPNSTLVFEVRLLKVQD